MTIEYVITYELDDSYIPSTATATVLQTISFKPESTNHTIGYRKSGSSVTFNKYDSQFLKEGTYEFGVFKKSNGPWPKEDICGPITEITIKKNKKPIINTIDINLMDAVEYGDKTWSDGFVINGVTLEEPSEHSSLTYDFQLTVEYVNEIPSSGIWTPFSLYYESDVQLGERYNVIEKEAMKYKYCKWRLALRVYDGVEFSDWSLALNDIWITTIPQVKISYNKFDYSDILGDSTHLYDKLRLIIQPLELSINSVYNCKISFEDSGKSPFNITKLESKRITYDEVSNCLQIDIGLSATDLSMVDWGMPLKVELDLGNDTNSMLRHLVYTERSFINQPPIQKVTINELIDPFSSGDMGGVAFTVIDLDGNPIEDITDFVEIEKTKFSCRGDRFVTLAKDFSVEPGGEGAGELVVISYKPEPLLSGFNNLYNQQSSKTYLEFIDWFGCLHEYQVFYNNSDPIYNFNKHPSIESFIIKKLNEETVDTLQEGEQYKAEITGTFYTSEKIEFKLYYGNGTYNKNLSLGEVEIDKPEIDPESGSIISSTFSITNFEIEELPSRICYNSNDTWKIDVALATNGTYTGNKVSTSESWSHKGAIYRDKPRINSGDFSCTSRGSSEFDIEINISDIGTNASETIECVWRIFSKTDQQAIAPYNLDTEKVYWDSISGPNQPLTCTRAHSEVGWSVGEIYLQIQVTINNIKRVYNYDPIIVSIDFPTISYRPNKIGINTSAVASNDIIHIHSFDAGKRIYITGCTNATYSNPSWVIDIDNGQISFYYTTPSDGTLMKRSFLYTDTTVPSSN